MTNHTDTHSASKPTRDCLYHARALLQHILRTIEEELRAIHRQELIKLAKREGL